MTTMMTVIIKVMVVMMTMMMMTHLFQNRTVPSDPTQNSCCAPYHQQIMKMIKHMTHEYGLVG